MKNNIFLCFISFLIVFSYSFSNYPETMGEIHTIYEKYDNLSPGDKLNEVEVLIFDKYETLKKDLQESFGFPYHSTDEVLADNIHEYFNNKYGAAFKEEVFAYKDYKYILLARNPNESPDKKNIVLLKYRRQPKYATSVSKTETNMMYKEIYFMQRIWNEAKDDDFLMMQDDLKTISNKWGPFFENVKGPQYFWEEGFNSWVSERKTILWLFPNPLSKDPEKYILEKPNRNQITILHPTPIMEYNEDDSKTLTPALGLQVFGVRRFNPSEDYKESWGASYVININSDSEDDELGHGIMFNYNQFDFGVIYRNSDRVDTKWWLTFGVNLAPLFNNTNSLPETYENFKDDPVGFYEENKKKFKDLSTEENSASLSD